MKDQIVKCFLCDGDHGPGPCPLVKAGVKCECGSTNTVWISGGGYQDADASRGMPMIETNGQIVCNDCGMAWWD